MKFFLIIILFFCFCLSGCGNSNAPTNNKDEINSYTTSRITTQNNTTNNIDISNNTNTETELSSFSTKIYTSDDDARQTNIRITCSKLDGTVVKPRRNFFFL